MRRVLVSAAFASLCALTYIACDPGATTSPESIGDKGKNQQHAIFSVDSATIPNTGTIHNQALAAVRSTYDFSASFGTPGAQATYILSRFCGYFYQEAGWDSAAYNTAAHRGCLVSMLVRKYPASDAEAWTALKMDSVFASEVPAAEISLIDNGISVFALSTSGMTSTQVANRIIGRADSLLTIWNNTSWGPHEGEASGGFLQIMKASASYWKNNPVSTTENPYQPLPELANIAQVDAAGYLYGWAMAVADEIDANGSLSSANEGKRIRAGLRMAGSWSMGGAIRNFFNS